MNPTVTSKEEIIAACQKIAKERGLEAISMRSVASECGMAVGSVYNYFSSKSELLCAAIENIWKDIFHMSASQCAFSDFVECLNWLFDSVQRGSQMYPEFFSRHAMVFASEDQKAGHQMMEKYFRHLEENLLNVLRRDPNVREDAFDEVLTPELFISYVLELFVSSVFHFQKDYRGILEIVRRCLYAPAHRFRIEIKHYLCKV